MYLHLRAGKYGCRGCSVCSFQSLTKGNAWVEVQSALEAKYGYLCDNQPLYKLLKS